jgi:hypothetical protein
MRRPVIGGREVLRSWLLELVDHLGQRLRHNGVRARTIEVKARSSEFKTYIRSVTLREPTDATEVIWQAAIGVFEQRVPQSWLPLRLLGVGGTGLVRDEQIQADLFDGAWHGKQRSLDQAVDAIREQFGGQAIKRGGGGGGELILEEHLAAPDDPLATPLVISQVGYWVPARASDRRVVFGHGMWLLIPKAVRQ